MKRCFVLYWTVAVLVGLSLGGSRSIAQLSGAGPSTPSESTQGDSPSGLDTSDGRDFDSPRSTMFTFLGAINRAVEDDSPEDWRQAIACLDLSLVDASRGRELAEDLLAVLNVIGEVTPGELPDARAVEAAGMKRHRYFPRPSEPTHVEILQNLAASGKPLAGSIVLARSASGVWLFSKQTVASIESLYAGMHHLPRQYAGQEAGHVLKLVGPTFRQTPMWGWGVLLASIFAGLFVGKVAQFGLARASQRCHARDWPVRATILEDLSNPLSLALLSLGLLVGLGFIGMAPPLRGFSNSVIMLLVTLAAAWFLFNLVDVVDLGMRRLAANTESKLDDQLVPLVRKTLRIFLVIVFLLFVAQNVLGFDITGWLAGLGIAGLAVSLAAQDSVKNLFGSLTVFFDKPFIVGDLIQFEGNTGTVMEIGFRSAKLRLLSGHVVTVPNMKFIDNAVENISARLSIRRQMDVTIIYGTPAEKIEQAVQILRDILTDPEVVEQGKFDMEESPPRVAFNELNADSLNIRAYYWYQLAADPDRGFFTYMEHCQLVNMKLFRAYEAAGIEFAFPTQTIHLFQEQQAAAGK